MSNGFINVKSTCVTLINNLNDETCSPKVNNHPFMLEGLNKGSLILISHLVLNITLNELKLGKIIPCHFLKTTLGNGFLNWRNFYQLPHCNTKTPHSINVIRVPSTN